MNNFILVSNKETPAAKTKQTWTFQHAAENQEHYYVILDPGFVLVLQAAKKSVYSKRPDEHVTSARKPADLHVVSDFDLFRMLRYKM